MSSYRQTLQIALAGVQGPLPEPLQSLAAECGSAGSPVQALYHAASLLTQAERSARPLPRRTEPAPQPAVPEMLKAPEGLFASLLVQGLNERNPFVERDKAELLIARGEHVPFVQLPDWLDYALTRSASERDLLFACMGNRGTWLADLNPDWRPLLKRPLDDSEWETGALTTRCAWLTALRARDPVSGRLALEAVWANEPPEAREKLLACLATGLSLEDQALLEIARTDKRKEVRGLALSLLAQLPDSDFVQRMLSRLRDWSSYTAGGLLRAAKLELRPPADYDKAWALDGIPEKTTRRQENIGDKANWLVEVLGYLPLRLVFQNLQIPPDSWARLLSEHEYGAALWIGSVNSFERNPSPELLACLRAAPLPALRAQVLRTALREAARSSRLDEWLTPLLDDDFDLAVALPLLPRLDLRWSKSLFKRLAAQVDANRERPYVWADLLPRFAERAHPDLLPEFLSFIDPLGNEPYVRKAVASATAIADLRHKLHQHRP